MKPFALHSASYIEQKDPKKNEIGRSVKSMGLGGMDTMLRKRNCRVGACGGAATTTLDHQALCLNHFLQHCYERLEGLDPRGRKFSAEPVDLAAMRAFIEECSRKALDVSLQSQNLSNLQRGRLLDILLWAGELFIFLRAPRFTLAQSMASSEGQLVARSASQSF
jgi:hypothetical protein